MCKVSLSLFRVGLLCSLYLVERSMIRHDSHLTSKHERIGHLTPSHLPLQGVDDCGPMYTNMGCCRLTLEVSATLEIVLEC